jgi:multiple sugar transport system substrate-binding protein
MMRLKKIFSAILAALLCCAVFGACGKSDDLTYVDEEGNVQKKTTLNFFGWGGVEEQEVFKTMVSEFNTLHKEYNVVYKAVTADNYITTLIQYKSNPKNMPDVFYMPDVNFVQWINETNIMLDLSSYIEKSDVFKLDNVWAEGINAYRFDPSSRKLGTGGIYALPKDLGPNVLAYNKNVAKNKGITVVSDPNGTKGYDPSAKTLNDRVPMTWAQFVKYCDDTKSGSLSDTNSIVGVTHYPLETAYKSIGGEFLDATRKTASINNDKFAESLQFVADLSNKFGVMTTAEGQSSQNGFQRFSSGLASTSFIGAWNTPELWSSDFDWDILPTPVPNQGGNLDDYAAGPREGSSSASYLGSVGIAVSAGSKNKEAAYKLAEFITVSETAQRINYKLGMAVPNLKDMAAGEFITTPLNDPKKTDGVSWNRPKNRQVYIDCINASERRIQSYTYNELWFNEMWESPVDSLKLIRVWSASGGGYGGHVDVWDWEAQSKIGGGDGFLALLEARMQAELDKYKDLYAWA